MREGKAKAERLSSGLKIVVLRLFVCRRYLVRLLFCSVPAARSDVEHGLGRARRDVEPNWESAAEQEGGRAGLAMGESALVSRAAMFLAGVKSSSLRTSPSQA